MPWWLSPNLALVPGIRSVDHPSAELFLDSTSNWPPDSGYFSHSSDSPQVVAFTRRIHPVTEGMSAGPRLLVATLIAFVLGLTAVAWLLRFSGADTTCTGSSSCRVLVGTGISCCWLPGR